MLSLLVCNGKGGVGKSTLTVLLALALARAQKRVALQDLDPQATAGDWLRRLDGGGGVLPYPLPPGDAAAEILLVDTPGRSELEAHIGGLPRAHLCIVPTTTTLGDQQVAKATIALVRRHQPGTTVKLLFNRVNAQARDARSLDEFARALDCPRLRNVVHDRKCYAYAQAQGWDALTPEAEREVLNLAIETIS